MDITPNPESLAQSHPHAHTDKLLEHLHFPKFKHTHAPVVNVNDLAADKLTVGQKVADAVANGMGSWRFIIIQATILLAWIVFNSVSLFWKPFDQYPYILLNLVLSFQAGFAAPVIMMSQNRQSEKDRLTAQNDYNTDCKGEEEIRHIMEHLDHQDDLILQIVTRLENQHQVMMGHLTRLDPDLAEKLQAEMKPGKVG